MCKIDENEPGKKTNKFFQKTNDGKQILRNMMSRYIPKEIIEAKKQGFSSPDASWFKGESIEFVKRKLLNKKAKIFDMFDYQAVEILLNQHFSGKQNRRLLIWSLLNVESWIDSNF